MVYPPAMNERSDQQQNRRGGARPAASRDLRAPPGDGRAVVKVLRLGGDGPPGRARPSRWHSPKSACARLKPPSASSSKPTTMRAMSIEPARTMNPPSSNHARTAPTGHRDPSARPATVPCLTPFTRANREAGHCRPWIMLVFGRIPGRLVGFQGGRAGEADFTVSRRSRSRLQALWNPWRRERRGGIRRRGIEMMTTPGGTGEVHARGRRAATAATT